VEDMTDAVREELRQKFFQVVEHREEIDRKIQEKARGWTLKRMAKADVTVLRLALYEILFDENIPSGVAINEAVEIAKKFGTDNSSSFVNGVLGSVVREQEKE
jgi:N utilization substance protein B